MSGLILAGMLFLGGVPMAPPIAASHDVTSARLPDLAMAPPGDFSVQNKAGGGRWLRFSTTVVNIGDGAFEIRGYEAEGKKIDTSMTLNVRQRIENGDGTWSADPVPATMSYAGDGHDHWHVHGLQRYELAYETVPENTIEEGAKRGFCFFDTDDYYGTGEQGHYDRATACHVASDEAAEWVPMGLSVGWGDKYPATIAGQYIDITGLPYGTYWLTVTADPSGEFIEEPGDNNVHRSKIRIERSGVTVLYQDPAPGTDITAPSAPVELKAEAGDTKIHLDWADNPETDVAQYNVYRKTDGGYLLHASATSSSYTDENLSNDGVEYCYQVTAVDSSGNESSPSLPVCATPTEGSSVITIHISDLEGSSIHDGRYWTATVIVMVHDSGETAVPGAEVSGSWPGGDGNLPSCITGSDGRCFVSSAKIPKSTGTVSFSVTSVSSGRGAYVSGDNHDADGDSDGTTIIVTKP